MTKQTEALKLALEALTYCEALNKDVEQQKMQAITAIKEALAQPAQEPVAWLVEFENGEQELHFDKQDVGESCLPLCLQRPWVVLTKADIDVLEMLYAPPVHPDFANDADHCLELIRQTEAKSKEKNNG